MFPVRFLLFDCKHSHAHCALGFGLPAGRIVLQGYIGIFLNLSDAKNNALIFKHQGIVFMYDCCFFIYLCSFRLLQLLKFSRFLLSFLGVGRGALQHAL